MTEKQKIFLLGYMPKDKHFTSIDEIDVIAEMLELNNKSSEELFSLRNNVVEFYNDDFEAHDDNRDYCYDRMTSLMSVTAVIDQFKYKV